ncbi:MAG: DUF4384 domain-containing protein [Candidatus Rokubacteria bacterium]|nr:DUF4384 domain-containing protein [Candidatus Rokubacteria bacterium]
MRRRVAPLALLLLAILTPAVAGAQTMSAALARVSSRLDGIAEVKGKKVGVTAFPMSAGHVSEFGAYLADQIDVLLAGKAPSGGFEVISRGALCQVIRENRLWVDDRFDPSLARKLGRLSPADLLVTGQVTPLARELSVSVRMLDTETARVLWAETLTIPLDDALRALVARRVGGDDCSSVAAAPAREQAPSGPEPLKVRIWTDKPAYRIGDTITFGLRVNRDAYVTLVDIGTSGDVTVIYPNRFSPSHFVRGGEDVMIPGAAATFTLRVQAPPGFEQVKAIVTEDPIKLHSSDFGPGGPVFRSLDRVQTRDLSVGFDRERVRVDVGKLTQEVIVVPVGR